MWCKICSSDLKLPLVVRGRSDNRTLHNLKEDHEKFITEGSGDLKKAKLYYNCISEPFFDICIDQVSKKHYLSIKIYIVKI